MGVEMAGSFGRRDFITLLGGAAAAWPLAADAQQPARRVIGYLDSGGPSPDPIQSSAFHQGLNKAGFMKGAMPQSKSDRASSTTGFRD